MPPPWSLVRKGPKGRATAHGALAPRGPLLFQMQPIREVQPTFLIAGRESMNWTGRSTKHKLSALVGVCWSMAYRRKRSRKIIMKKKYGVCLGMLAMGLAVLGAPASRAQSRTAAAGSGGSSETTTTSESATPAASSPTDLDRRIDAPRNGVVGTQRRNLHQRRTLRRCRPQGYLWPPRTPVTAGEDDNRQLAWANVVERGSWTSTTIGIPTTQSIKTFLACAFDCRDKSISLNMIELILDKAPDATAGELGRTGYHFSVGYGDTEVAINNAEFGSSGAINPGAASHSSAGFDQYVKEAYFSYLAPIGSGLQIDVGKFVTPLGAEVIESKDNWNYSRGLLFNFAIPLNHFGVRAKYTFSPKFNVTGYLVNGFNNVVDNNSGKTYGVSAGWNPTKKNTVTLNYFAGPEQTTDTYGPSGVAGVPFNVDGLWRQTWDVVFMYNLTPKLTFMANYDYVHGDRLILNDETDPWKLSKPVYYTGAAGYLKYAFNDKNYVAARYEYFYDRNGFVSGGLRW